MKKLLAPLVVTLMATSASADDLTATQKQYFGYWLSATIAVDKCSNLAENPDKEDEIARKYLQIQVDQMSSVAAYSADETRKVIGAYERGPAEFCYDAVHSFGPHGVIVARLLKVK